MPKNTHKVPSYRCNKTSGRVVVTIDGKDHWLGKYGTPDSRSRYNRMIAEWLANGRRTPTRLHADLTVVELSAAYWHLAKTYYCAKHLHKIKCALRPLRELYGTVRVSDFGPMALKTVQLVMVKKGLGRTTINYLVSLVRSLFKWGVEHELVPFGVHHALQAVSGLRCGRSDAREPDPVEPVPDAHVDSVRPHVSR